MNFQRLSEGVRGKSQSSRNKWVCDCVVLVVGQAVLSSCAYSGRVAVAYVSDYVRPHPTDTTRQLINLFVTVYECESTGQ